MIDHTTAASWTEFGLPIQQYLVDDQKGQRYSPGRHVITCISLMHLNCFCFPPCPFCPHDPPWIKRDVEPPWNKQITASQQICGLSLIITIAPSIDFVDWAI